MRAEVPHLTSILIELRALEKARSLTGLVAQHLEAAGEKLINLDAIPCMLREGRIVLLFDGFDELVTRVTYERAADHFETLLQAAGGRAKVIVTSRTQHFVSDQQVKQKMLELTDGLPGLRRAGGDAKKAAERFALIDEVKDLLGLSRNPRILSIIAKIEEEQDLGQRERRRDRATVGRGNGAAPRDALSRRGRLGGVYARRALQDVR